MRDIDRPMALTVRVVAGDEDLAFLDLASLAYVLALDVFGGTAFLSPPESLMINTPFGRGLVWRIGQKHSNASVIEGPCFPGTFDKEVTQALIALVALAKRLVKNLQQVGAKTLALVGLGKEVVESFKKRFAYTIWFVDDEIHGIPAKSWVTSRFIVKLPFATQISPMGEFIYAYDINNISSACFFMHLRSSAFCCYHFLS